MAERSRSHNRRLVKGYVYIFKCSDGSYYTGSTIELDKRINEHQGGRGANHTKKNCQLNWFLLKST
ncbi:GIY-YIG nuclease family protein [Flagellimonas beolgyonensis]|uniref:GIY-YIG nuclease family protein n=1 Tax=Flagellimonas beolgyonensis TaxID=864064 RepID=UPI003257741D